MHKNPVFHIAYASFLALALPFASAHPTFAQEKISDPVPEFAQATGSAQHESRYSFHLHGDYITRLDAGTGSIDECTFVNQKWVCRLGSNDRQTLNDEIKRLKSEIDQLKIKNSVACSRQKSVGPLIAPEDRDEALGILNKTFTIFDHVIRYLGSSSDE